MKEITERDCSIFERGMAVGVTMSGVAILIVMCVLDLLGMI